MNEHNTCQWSDDYRIGHEIIDIEHQYLFSLLQDLQNAFYHGEGDPGIMVPPLQYLLEYSRIHFQSEEELMLMCHYAGYESHREEHNRFLRQLENFLDRVWHGEPILKLGVMLYLKGGLTIHLLEKDRELTHLIY